MNTRDIILAWKDAVYRTRLSTEQQALFPDHPADVIELHNEELQIAMGAADSWLNSCDFQCMSPLCVPSFQQLCLNED